MNATKPCAAMSYVHTNQVRTAAESVFNIHSDLDQQGSCQPTLNVSGQNACVQQSAR